jgi:hypothetical protein
MNRGDSGTGKNPHEYYANDGRQLISVTQALRLSKVMDTSHYPDDPRARLLGSAVHEATAFLDSKNVLWDEVRQTTRGRWDSVDPEVGNYVRAWEAFKARTGFTALVLGGQPAIELRLRPIIGQIQYGMRVDRVGLLNGKPAIPDLKCSQQDEPWWAIQLALYELGVVAEYGPPKVRPYKYARYGVRLTPHSASEPYRLELFDDPTDYEVAKAALVIAVWRKNHYRIEI